MNKHATSKSLLLETAKSIACEEGLSGISIRKTALKSGIAIGTVYNYYPSKADLIIAIIEDFWKMVFHNDDYHFENQTSFIEVYRHLFVKLKENLVRFQTDILSELTSLDVLTRRKGKQTELLYWNHIKSGLLCVINHDKHISPHIWTVCFTKEAFLTFSLSNLISVLKNKESDFTFIEQVICKLLYQNI